MITRKRLGMIFMLAAAILPVVRSAFIYQDAETRLELFYAHRPELYDRYELLKSADIPGRYVIFGIYHHSGVTDSMDKVNDAVIRFSDGSIWEAKGGNVTILWGGARSWRDPLLVAKAHAPLLILFLVILAIGVLMRHGGKVGGQADRATETETPVPVPSTRIVPPPAATEPPDLRTAPEAPSKTKFVAFAGVALIFIVTGVLYFSYHGAKKGDVSWSVKPGKSKGEVTVNLNDGLKYVWIPPGMFMMGCSPGDTECGNDEKPPHQVTITKGFWLGQAEVTVGAYKRFAGATGRQMPPEPDFTGRSLNHRWGDEAMPIVDVYWDDAQAYCSWAGGRLPTEAEWEYAARPGSTVARYAPLDEIAWYSDNSGSQRLDLARILEEDGANYEQRLKENGNGMHEVGQKRANGFGLYDMLGNVLEWVDYWYDEKYYQISPSRDAGGPTSGTKRVLRGGSWIFIPTWLRVSFRTGRDPAYGDVDIGFRCGGEVFAP